MEAPGAIQDPLDRLPAQVNTVLTQIGRIFQQAPRGNDIKSIGQGRVQSHEAIVRASRQFHEALDEVEIEILRNKSVLERDLEKHRARRAEKERALKAEAEPTPPPQLSPSALPATDEPLEQPSTAEKADDLGDDIVMIDPNEFDLIPAQAVSSQPEPISEQPQPPTADASAQKPAAAGAASSTTAQPNTTALPTSVTPLEDPLGASFVNIPANTNLPDGGDFNSMLDFDFLGLDATAGGESGEGIDALMPGLESIVGANAGGAPVPPAGTVQPAAMVATGNSGGVAPVADMSRGNSTMGANANASTQQQQPQKQQEGQKPAADGAQDGANPGDGAGDPGMDDLFFGTEGLDDFGAGEGLGNLDFDSWLN